MSSRVYPMSVGEPPSAAFAMTVDGVPAPLYSARVSKHPINRRWPGHQRPMEQTELANFALFEMDAPAQIVLKPSRPFHNVIVRPLSCAVHPRVEAGVISFTLPRAGAYTVELDGPHCALHLFCRPGETLRRRSPGRKRALLWQGHSRCGPHSPAIQSDAVPG